MADCRLPPETRLDLRIHLDRLRSAEERCRESLRQLSDGTSSLEQFREVLREQETAHREWVRKQEKYFPALDV